MVATQLLISANCEKATLNPLLISSALIENPLPRSKFGFLIACRAVLHFIIEAAQINFKFLCSPELRGFSLKEDNAISISVATELIPAAAGSKAFRVKVLVVFMY